MLSPLPRRSRGLFLLIHPAVSAFPEGSSGRPAHRPFRGLLGVHSRYGLHRLSICHSSKHQPDRRGCVGIPAAARTRFLKLSFLGYFARRSPAAGWRLYHRQTEEDQSGPIDASQCPTVETYASPGACLQRAPGLIGAPVQRARGLPVFLALPVESHLRPTLLVFQGVRVFASHESEIGTSLNSRQLSTSVAIRAKRILTELNPRNAIHEYTSQPNSVAP
jgi:hypothetical protein